MNLDNRKARQSRFRLAGKAAFDASAPAGRVAHFVPPPGQDAGSGCGVGLTDELAKRRGVLTVVVGDRCLTDCAGDGSDRQYRPGIVCHDDWGDTSLHLPGSVDVDPQQKSDQDGDAHDSSVSVQDNVPRARTDRLVELVADWQERYECPTPTSHLSRELQTPEPLVAVLVDLLVARGLVHWFNKRPFGPRDVALGKEADRPRWTPKLVAPSDLPSPSGWVS